MILKANVVLKPSIFHHYNTKDILEITVKKQKIIVQITKESFEEGKKASNFQISLLRKITENYEDLNLAVGSKTNVQICIVTEYAEHELDIVGNYTSILA